ncbi:MAG TPA: protease pro-enzyme activation domain-containing protein, partial [Candidatus Eremiobacteraceae bacterium]
MLVRLLSFAAVLVLVTGAGMNAAAAATAPIGIGRIANVRDLGPAPASVGVRLAVVMKYHRDADLESLTEAQADPSSPLYHHFLSPAQFANYFAPTPAEYGRVIASLQRGGFTITHVFPNRTVVDAIAPAPVAARYFNTDI